jgi:hypothetical protein
MPQLDFVSFHYIINTLSFSYLFVYVTITLFLLKPIFKECFLLYSYPTSIVFDIMLLAMLFSDKVLFTKLMYRTPSFSRLRAKVKKK